MTNNQLIVESQDTGKTTYLFNEVDRLYKEGFNLVVMDSATEHEDKSLLRKVENKYSNTVTIDLRDEKQIVLGRVDICYFIEHYNEFFPFNEIMNNKDKILLFDLSYFLEKGHEVYDETSNAYLYKYYRNLYNQLSEQIALMLILMDRDKLIDRSYVIMDEIEFPITDYTIDQFEDNICFMASIHPENSFGTFYESFDKLKFQKYIRKE